ncbi:MAG: SpoIIE family protein phosphatase [Treponema sp.]|jgi:sigma-B regulation protein RsbU (phosphoserine phosphatase)|nr:SpoIIE family protein phosphatase [Treponema sp.]
MSIRLKILVIVLGFFSLVAAVFAVYSAITTANYRQHRTNEVSMIVAFESERVDKAIAEMERNAVDLALAGYHFFNAREHSDETGESISIENFSAFTAAVGGGIWYEPYALRKDTRRVCYYAFFDPNIGSVRHDPDFQTSEYDYHTQMWYMTIAANLSGKHSTVWTAPYYDDTGTNSLMTTVGAGIYDNAGHFVGMSTVDWQIQSMADRLSAIKPTENSFVLLASPSDDYIISNTYESGTESTGSSLRSLHWYEHLRFVESENVSIGRFTESGAEYISFSRLFDNGWLFSVQIPSREIFAEIETRNRQFILIITMSFILLLLAASYLLSRLINRPLLKLTSGVAELGAGNLDKKIEMDSKDEIGTLAAVFNKMTVDLKASIEQNARERAEKERIGAELNVATQIQSSMLPCIFPAFPDRPEFDIYATMQPAKEVGGDFYDLFLVNDNTLAVVIADVSGKGVPAALFMVIAKTLIKNNAQYGKSPKEVFETVNNLLCENNEASMFVTAFLGYLDIPSGRFSFVNAGHNPPLWYSGGHFDWLQTKRGLVLAGMEDMVYKQGEIILRKGDTLFMYTDGVTEAMNKEKKLFSDGRLLETANRYTDLPLKEFTITIKREIDKFADGEEQADDITMLVLRCKGEGGISEI